MKNKFTPGTKVIASRQYADDDWDDVEEDKIVKYIKDEFSDETLVGEVLARPASVGKVWVNWFDGDIDEGLQEVDIKVLSLESEKNDLEKDFKLIENQIKEKMKAAGALVKEANKMAKKAGARNLESLYGAVSPLVNAMDNAGWHSSSWGC